MAAEHGDGGEESRKWSFELLLSDFKLEIMARLCESVETGAQALVRREERQLDERGDFSLPSITSKIWARQKLKEGAFLSSLLSPSNNLVLQDESRSILKVVKVREMNSGAVAIHLDRAVVIKHILTRAKDWYGDERKDNVFADNCDPSPLSSLTYARVQIFTECLNRLPLCSKVTVSSTSFPSNVSGIKVRVGPVLGETGRKEERETVEQLNERVRENVGKLDEERRNEEEAVEVTLERRNKLKKAFLNFAFLSSSISNPVRINMQNQQSHFVMYNKARISRLLATFDEQVGRGIYPAVPTDLGQIDFSLLTEPEEWELVWVHLSRVEEVINHCSKVLSLHKLVHLLCSMATTYSRYYNRVKMLKDPLPSLVPTIHARVVLTRHIDAVFDCLLNILGSEPLDIM